MTQFMLFSSLTGKTTSYHQMGLLECGIKPHEIQQKARIIRVDISSVRSVQTIFQLKWAPKKVSDQFRKITVQTKFQLKWTPKKSRFTVQIKFPIEMDLPFFDKIFVFHV